MPGARTRSAELRRALLLLWIVCLPSKADHAPSFDLHPPSSAHLLPDLHLQRDVIIAVPSCVAYLNFVHAMRPLRLGIRTFITVESEEVAAQQNSLVAQHPLAPQYPEVYAHHPDNPAVRHKTYKLHEGRWLLTPFMAHQHYQGQYKWMLLGDDDTLWLMSGVRQLLAAYDPDLPYWISDSLAELQDVVGEAAPKIALGHTATATLCLPCHTPAPIIQRMQHSYPEGSEMRSLAWTGCPCTAQQGCAHRYARCQLPDLRGLFAAPFVGNASSCSSPTSAYGGTGMVLSAALMQRLPAEAARQLAPTLYQWGDYRLALHIRDSGFALTYPDESAVATGALDNRRYKLFGHDSLPHIFRGANNSLAACARQLGAKQCNWSVVHAVSCHLRHKGDSSQLAERLRNVALSLRLALGALGQPLDHLQGV